MDPIITGPYEFGDQPPWDLCGWAGEQLGEAIVRREFERLAHNFLAFGDIPRAPMATQTKPHIWEYAKRVNGGKHFTCIRQLIGDCVAAGLSGAMRHLSAFQIAALGKEEKFRDFFIPWFYGTSRYDVGGGRLGGGDGSLGSWAAEAFKKYGALFVDDPNVPQYTSSVAKSWGRKPPKEFYPVANDNLILSAVQLNSVDEIRKSLLDRDAYRVVTIASNQGWAMQPVEYKGYHCFRSSGSFAHQTCLLSWMTDPFEAAYRLNSWGENAHGTPLNGEPAGGGWWRVEDLEREMRSRGVELFEFSLFQGDPGPANPSPL